MEENKLCSNCGSVYSYQNSKCPYCFNIDYKETKRKLKLKKKVRDIIEDKKFWARVNKISERLKRKGVYY